MSNIPQRSPDSRPNIPPTENYDTAAVHDRAAPYDPEGPEDPPQVVPPVIGGGSPVHLDVDEPVILDYHVFPPGSVEAQHGSSSGSGSRALSTADTDEVATQAAMLDYLSIDENIPPERVTSADYDQMFASALHTRMEGLEASGGGSSSSQFPAAEEIDEQSFLTYRGFTDLPLCSDCGEPMRRIRSLEPRGFSAYTNANLCRNCIDRRGQVRPDFIDHSYSSVYYQPHNSPSLQDRSDSVGPSIPLSLAAPDVQLVSQVFDEPIGSMIFSQAPNFLQVSPNAASAFHAAGAGEYYFQQDSRRDSTGSATSPVRHNLRSPNRQSPYSTTQRRSPGGRLQSLPDIADPNQSRSPDVLTALVSYSLSHPFLHHDDSRYSQSKNSTILRNLVQLKQDNGTGKFYIFVPPTNKHKAEKLTDRNVHDIKDSLCSFGVSFDSTSDEYDDEVE